MNREASSDRKAALVYALLACGTWGFFPVYWKLLGAISPWEVISHRLIWSLVFLTVFAGVRGRLGECLAVARRPRLLGVLFLTASLLSINWGVFIYAVGTNQVVEASLGYFISPLVNVLLGFLVLRERLPRIRWVAVGLAAVGVVAFGWHLSRLPWVALSVAFSFGVYGLIRKMISVEPLAGLIVETATMLPAALGILAFFAAHGTMHFTESPTLALLFMGGGAVTAFPLLWFISAAKLLPLSTLGFFQYIVPCLQLLVGVVVYREPFTHRDIMAFAFIWTAIAIFLASSRRTSRQPVPATESQIPA